jgi:predicted glycosyltransferase
MNILFDVGHPAHVHLFACAAHKLEERGHKVLFTIRDRALIPELLKAYGFGYQIASKPRTGKVGQSIELIEHDWNVFKVACKFKPDFMLGTSVAIAHVSRILKGKSIVFNEDDAKNTKLFANLAYPFADSIVTPAVLDDKKTHKYIPYEGYHELAYLHPNNFSPDPSILDELGVKKNTDFFILRFVAFKAFHDVDRKGFNIESQLKVVEMLSACGKVFITNEGDIPDALKPYQLPIPPHRIHHAINYAKMLISDGGTMPIEAAVLGTPAIVLNTFVDTCSVIKELENKYALLFGFHPGQEEEMFGKIDSLLQTKDLKKIWASRRDRMLAEKVDLTEWIVNLLENYQSIAAGSGSPR